MCTACACGTETVRTEVTGEVTSADAKVYSVSGMTCGHCVSSVSGEIGGIGGVTGLAVANLAMALLGAAWIPMWYFLNLYLQQVLGYSAFPSGAALLPMTIAIMIFMVGITARLLGRFGAKPLIVIGLTVLAAGVAGLSLVRPDGTFAVDVLPASLIAAVGMSLAYIPAMMSAMSGARPEESGLASGIVNTTYQIGSALGLAAMTALATGGGATAARSPAELTDGFQAAFVGAAVVALAGAVLTSLVMRRPKPVTPVATDAGAASTRR